MESLLGFPFWSFTYLSQTNLSTIQFKLSLEQRGGLEGNADPYSQLSNPEYLTNTKSPKHCHNKEVEEEMGGERQRRMKLQNNNREEENLTTQPEYALRLEIKK